MGIVQPNYMPGELDHRALHAEADAEEGDLPLAGEADRLDLPLDSPLAEPARHQNAIVAREQPLRPFALDLLALDAADPHLGVVRDARMVERFVDALVGVLVLGVFADDRDADLLLRVAEAMEQVAPVVELERPGIEPQLLDDQLV